MKKFVFLSLLTVGAVSATPDTQEVIENLYEQLVQRSSRIDTDDEEQRGELCDVLGEVKAIVDDCNTRLTKVLAKYPTLREELNLQGALTLNLSVDTDAQ